MHGCDLLESVLAGAATVCSAVGYELKQELEWEELFKIVSINNLKVHLKPSVVTAIFDSSKRKLPFVAELLLLIFDTQYVFSPQY